MRPGQLGAIRACTARFADGTEVRFGLEPRTLPLVAPLRIAVDVHGNEANSVEVDFAGTDSFETLSAR